MERTDTELLRAYGEEGSEAAFGELVRRHLGLVYGVARRVVVDEHLAEDVAQATFAILAREARHLQGRTVLASWLHRTAANQSAKLVRGEMRRRAREQEAYAMEKSGPEGEAAWERIAPRLDGALNRLGEADRAVLLLRFFEKKSAREIGTSLAVSEAAAQKRLGRALERLRGLLGHPAATVPSATLASLLMAEAVAATPSVLTGAVTTAALAGATTAGAFTFTTLKLIVMSKLKTSAVAALIAAGIGTPLVLQHQTIERLRAGQSPLEAAARRAGDLEAERERLARELAQARDARALSQGQLTELMRLRGEVGPLRRDSQDLARLRAEQLAKRTDAVTPASGADYLPAATWANVGAAKPESAIQTFLWAGKHGEMDLVGKLLRWQRDADIPASGELDQTFAEGLVAGTTRFAGSLQGFRVVTEDTAGDNETRLGIELTDEQGKAQVHKLRLVKEDGQWFPVMHVWLAGEGSVQAALDVPAKFQQGK